MVRDMENQMQKTVESEMETGLILACIPKPLNPKPVKN